MKLTNEQVITNLKTDFVEVCHPSDGRLVLLNKNKITWLDHTLGVDYIQIHTDNGEVFYGNFYSNLKPA